MVSQTKCRGNKAVVENRRVLELGRKRSLRSIMCMTSTVTLILFSLLISSSLDKGILIKLGIHGGKKKKYYVQKLHKKEKYSWI